MNTRKDFSILKRKVNGKSLVYFDNAATTQKPKQVIDAITKYYETSNANVHRGIHTLSEEATAAYEGARETIATFIGANDPSEIIFTRNATEAINLVANSFLGKRLAGNGQVLLTEMEHHSNMVPWMQLSRSKVNGQVLGVRLAYIPVTDEGVLDLSGLEKIITKKTALVSLTHASNVLGTINDIASVIKVAKKKGVPVLVDAAQSIPHLPVNVQKLGCDFLVFSGHKMLGPTGTGVLWAKKEHLEKMQPFMGGGDMVIHVDYDSFVPNELPWKFEAGTPNVAGAIGLAAAVEYLDNVGMRNIRRHELALTKYALKKMEKISGMTIYGPISAEERTGVIAFNIDGIHPHDLASILDEEGIAIRSGYHCAEPLVKRFGVSAMARASFYIYNTREEVDRFITALKRVKKTFDI